MKIPILNIQGEKIKEISLPKFFSSKIKEGLVLKILEAKKNAQPYAPYLMAGKQHAAKGKTVHRRHVWRSGYGRGMSRVPRKIFLRRGSQFNWEAAEVPFARGGMRAHPPKVLSRINTKKINKKELRLAFISALTATADKKQIQKKYEKIQEIEKNLPIIVESKIDSLKSKEFIALIKKILGENLFKIIEKQKKIRKGVGKLRGRKHKVNAGLLIVVGKNEKIKSNAFEIKKAETLGINDLAKGGLGRLTIYTEEAIKDLEKKIK